MPSNRLETLKSMVEQQPNVSFLRYGLAMEYRNAGDLDAAIAEFRELMKVDPDYSAAYFHGGATAEREFLTLRSGDGVPQCGRSRRSDRGISRTDEGGSRLFRGIFPWRADAGAARPPGRGPRFVPRRD